MMMHAFHDNVSPAGTHDQWRGHHSFAKYNYYKINIASFARKINKYTSFKAGSAT